MTSSIMAERPSSSVRRPNSSANEQHLPFAQCAGGWGRQCSLQSLGSYWVPLGKRSRCGDSQYKVFLTSRAVHCFLNFLLASAS